jgi:hypothetical protein
MDLKILVAGIGFEPMTFSYERAVPRSAARGA